MVLPELEPALSVVDKLVARVGGSLTEQDRLLLLQPYDAIDGSVRERVAGIYADMMRGFFDCVSEGVLFADLSRIKATFGRTLEENYPEASPAFIKFARTHWTFKLFSSDLERSYTSKHDPMLNRESLNVFVLLGELEFDISSVFFPTPGPTKWDPDSREAAQREILSRFAPKIDIEDFIQHNPILIRDRGGRGWFSWPWK